MEPFTNAVGLRVVGLGSGMVDVLHRQVELVGVVLRLPAVLGAPVSEDAKQLDALLIEKWDHPVVEQISCGDGALVGVELGSGHPAVGINEGLLIDPAHALDGTYIVGVLGTQVAGMLRLDLVVGFLGELRQLLEERDIAAYLSRKRSANDVIRFTKVILGQAARRTGHCGLHSHPPHPGNQHGLQRWVCVLRRSLGLSGR